MPAATTTERDYEAELGELRVALMSVRCELGRVAVERDDLARRVQRLLVGRELLFAEREAAAARIVDLENELERAVAELGGAIE